MIFDYLRLTQALDTIDFPDIGNVAINALNDYGQEWYLIITTRNGWTVIKEFGPLIADTEEITHPFRYDTFAYDYKDTKIAKVIDKFLNDQKRMITQAMEVEKEFAEGRLDVVRRLI